MKYYKPTLKELNKKITYEYLFNGKWFTNTANIDSTVLSNVKNIRIKSLDKEDILDLGWVYEESHYTFTIKDKLYHLYLENNKIHITVDNNEDIIYRGLCRNKSELKWIMNMVE